MRSAAKRLTGHLRAIFPHLSEPVEPGRYRLVGKARFFVVMLLIAMDVGLGVWAKSFAANVDFYWRLMIPNLSVLGAAMIGGLILWRVSLQTATMRRLNQGCALFEMTSVLLAQWSLGSVNSVMLVFGVLLTVGYRVLFDFATGLLCFAIFLGGSWLMVALEVTGSIPSQPLFRTIDNIYLSTWSQLGTMGFATILIVLVYWATNWVVVHLRHKDLAIRILRASLAATKGAELGRHTGRTLNDTYVVGTVIGRGGMSEVYEGHHRRSERPVAIKLLHPHLIADPLLLKRFRREAEIAGGLGSRHIVEVLDVDVDPEDDQPFMVFELLEGESLSERLEKHGPLVLDEVGDIIGQAAQGVAVAHRGGVIHRDLKPENLFLCRDGDGILVKILDFGISKIGDGATALTQEVALLGTPSFMSPEQALGKLDELDVTTDIFALGAITYTALTGVRPFDASSVPATLRRICDDAPTPITTLRPEVPAGVEKVVTIAMAKPCHQRYQDVAELASDLRAALAGDADPALVERANAVDAGRSPAQPAVIVEPGGDVLALGKTLPSPVSSDS